MTQELMTAAISEIFGTSLLTLLGGGVVANVTLARTGGRAGGPMLIYLGWGLAVFAGVTVAFSSGAHLNPAVTTGIVLSGATEFVPGVAVSALSIAVYIVAQILGAFIGAVFCYLAYQRQFANTEDQATKLGVFATAPTVPSRFWNTVTEAIATFVLVIVVLGFGHQGDPKGLAALGALPVALLVIAIGSSLGGPTGYAINPARDLGPRLAHAVLPIPGKGSSNWGYAWVPIVGPLIGGAVAGLSAAVLLPTLG